MKIAKKALSMFLSLLMIFTVCSVGLDGVRITAEAATAAEVQNLINQAVAAADITAGSGNSWTYTVKSKETYVVLEAAQAIYDYAVNTVGTANKNTDELAAQTIAALGFNSNSEAAQLITNIISPAGTAVYNESNTTTKKTGTTTQAKSYVSGAKIDTGNFTAPTGLGEVNKTATVKVDEKALLLSYAEITDFPANLIPQVIVSFKNGTASSATATADTTYVPYQKGDCDNPEVPESWSTPYEAKLFHTISTRNCAPAAATPIAANFAAFVAAFTDAALKQTIDDMVKKGTTALNSEYNAANAAYASVYNKYNKDFIDHFYGEGTADKIVKYMEDLTFAADVANAMDSIEALYNVIKTAYGVNDLSQMNSLLAQSNTLEPTAKNLEKDELAYILKYKNLAGYEGNTTADAEKFLSDVDAFQAAIFLDIETYRVYEIKASVDAAIKADTPLVADKYGVDDVTDEVLQSLPGKYKAFGTSMTSQYSAAAVARVFPDGYSAYIAEISRLINEKLAVREIKAVYQPIYDYYTLLYTNFSQWKNGDFAWEITDADGNVIGRTGRYEEDAKKLEELKTAYTDLKNKGYLQEDIDKIFSVNYKGEDMNLIAAVEDYLSLIVDAATERVQAQLDALKNNAYANSEKEIIVNFKNNVQIGSALFNYSEVLYLHVTVEHGKSVDDHGMRAQIEALQAAYDAFIATGGLGDFEQKHFDENGVYIERPAGAPEYPNDIARDGEEDDYTVTDKTIEAIIDKLDAFITSEAAMDILPLDSLFPAEEGADPVEYANIAEMVDGLIGSLFTDDTINMLVGMLFPMVANLLETELATMLADLAGGGAEPPEGVSAQLPLGDLVTDFKADGLLNVYLNKDVYNGQQRQKSYAEVFNEINVNLYPEVLAKQMVKEGILDANSEFYNTLVAAKDNWTALAVDPAAETPEYAFDYAWGVTDYDSFVSVLGNILDCLGPIGACLIGNTPIQTPTVERVGYAATAGAVTVGVDGVPLLGSISVSGTIESDAGLSLGIQPVNIYDKIWIPLLEALGYTDRGNTIAAIPTDADGEALVKALLDPLFVLIDDILNAPVNSVLEILPALSYVLSIDKIQSILNTVEIALSVKLVLGQNPSVKLESWAALAQGLVAGFLKGMELPFDVDPINLGAELNLKDTLGLNYTDLNELIKMIAPDAALPPLQQTDLIYLAELNKNAPSYRSSGSRLKFTADKADVLYYLLNYAIGLLSEGGLESLLGDSAELPEFVTELLGKVMGDTDKLLLLLSELLVPGTYSTADMDWFKSEFKATLDSDPTPFNAVYLNYGNDWTEDKAKYLTDNLVDIINEVLAMTGSEVTDVNAMLQQLVNDGLNGVFTAEAVTTLILGIAGMGKGEMEPMLADLLGSILEADFAEMYKAFGYLLPAEEPAEGEEPAPVPFKPGDAEYVNTTGIEAIVDADGNITGWIIDGVEFVDGDKDTFFKLVFRALGAFMPTIGKLLTGGKISALGLLDINFIDGYSDSLALLFEALGIDVPDQEELEGIVSTLGAEAALLRVVGDVFKWFEGVFAEDANTVMLLAELLPNLLYFIESNGLSVVVRNLLHPILVLVDSVRPLVDINVNAVLSYFISELVNGKELALDIDALLPMILEGTFPAPEDPENYKYVAIDVKEITLTKVLEIVDVILGTNLAGSQIKAPGLDAMFAYTEGYTAANGEKAYRVTTELHNALTILISAAIEALYVKVPGTETTNADAIFAMIGDEKIANIVGGVLEIILGFEFEYKAPDWDYLVEEGADLTALEPRASITYLQYTTDWTEAKAQDVYASLDEVLATFLPALLADSGAENLAMLVEGLLADNVYNDDIFNMIVETIVNLFAGINASLFEHIDTVLETEITKWFSFCEIDEETGKYVCTKEWNVSDRASFKAALEEVLAPVDKVLAFVFFGDGLEFFTGSEKDENGGYIFNDIIDIEGVEGYNYAIVPILEALGLTLPTAAELNYKTSAAVSAILDQLFNLIDKLADAESTVEVVFELLPNLIYFINADGLKNSVNNLLNAADKIIAAVAPVAGLEETSIKDLIGEIKLGDATLDITDLSMDTLLGIAGAFGVNISADMLDIIKNLYVGQFEEFTSANGLSAYRLNVEGYEYDVLTIILSVAIDLFNINEELFAGLLGENGAAMYAAIKRVIAGYEVILSDINWAYMCKTDAEKEALLNAEPPVFPEATFTYLDYTTDWTPEVAESVYDALDDVLELVLPSLIGNDSVKTIVEGLLNDNVYSDEILVTVVELIVNAIGGLDESLRDLIDVVLDTEIYKWFEEDFCKYNEETGKIECVYDFGIDEAADSEKASKFIAGLEKILEPANSLLSWLFFGSDIKLLNGTTNEVLITLNGGEGYAYGIAPILEALGLYMKPASEYVIDADKEIYNVSGAVSDILSQVLTLVDKLETYESTAEYVFTLIPGLIYFINADGLKVSVNNLIAPVNDLFATISVFFGEELAGKDLAGLINGFIPADIGLDITDITTDALLSLLEEKLGFIVSEDMAQAIYNIYVTGDAVKFAAANGKNGFRVDAKPYDVLTVILSFAIDAFNLNEALFADLLGGEDKYNAIVEILRGAAEGFTYIDPNWAYMYDGEDALAQLANNNGKFPVRQNNAFDIYTSYQNNWNEATIDELNAVLDLFVQNIMVLAKDGQSIGSILDNAIANKLYTEDILNSLIELAVGALVGYEDIIAQAGVLLGAESIANWFSDEYVSIDAEGNVTCVKDWGFDAAATNAEKKAAFVEGFVTVLEPAYDILAWLLFGDDFTFLNGTTNETLITIKGGLGYDKAFVPLLEALGATMGYEGTDSGIKPASAYVTANGIDMETAVRDIFTAVTDVLSAICGDLQNPAENGAVGTMLNILPNVIYFINAGGLKAVVNNLLNPVNYILTALKPFGLEVDFDTLIEGVPLTKLDWYGIFGLLETLLNLHFPDYVQEFLATFYIGKAESFTSANGNTAYKMVFTEEETRADFITVVISFIADAFVDDRNADTIKGWFGADNAGIYDVIIAYLTNNSVKINRQDFSWLFTDKADTGELFTPITMDSYYGYVYGELYTREMGAYIEKWLPSFVDSMIVLLGVQDANGVNYEGLQDVLNTLVGSTVYKTENISALYDALTGLIGDLKAEIGEDFFNQIAGVLKNSLGVDINYLMNEYQVPEITEGDREAFVDALLDMLSPVYPILEWLLTSKDIAFFHSADPALQEKNDRVVLPGAEGYAYGIIPLLEALGCENVLTPEDYKLAVAADKTALLRNIVDPILDKVDALLADPLNELVELLPGVIYFVNSNGLDTVIKNTANAVFGVLATIEPLIGELDLYGMIEKETGIDVAAININSLIDMLLAGLEEDTGFKIKDVAIDAVNELTVGEIVSFTSQNGLTAYTMKYANGADRADMITVLLRFVLSFVSVPENVVALEAMLEGQLDGDGYKFVCSLLENFSQMAAKEGGMDEIMYTVYQIFYAANVASHSTEDWLAEFNGDYSFLNQLFKTSDLDFLRQIEASLGDLLNKYTGDIIDDDEIVPNGFLAFFQKIAEFFRKIADFFKNLFK